MLRRRVKAIHGQRLGDRDREASAYRVGVTDCRAGGDLICTSVMDPGATQVGVSLPRRWRERLGYLLVLSLVWQGILGYGQTRAKGPVPLSPDEFRAAFLSKVPGFVTWRESAFGPTDEALTIVILGGATFGPILEGLLKDVRVGDRPVLVRSVEKIEELPRCQILFIPEARSSELARLPAALRDGLLTVGEDAGFTRMGGVFNLSLADRKLTVNVRNARAAGLELQSRLLRIAEVER